MVFFGCKASLWWGCARHITVQLILRVWPCGQCTLLRQNEGVKRGSTADSTDIRGCVFVELTVELSIRFCCCCCCRAHCHHDLVLCSVAPSTLNARIPCNNNDVDPHRRWKEHRIHPMTAISCAHERRKRTLQLIILCRAEHHAMTGRTPWLVVATNQTPTLPPALNPAPPFYALHVAHHCLLCLSTSPSSSFCIPHNRYLDVGILSHDHFAWVLLATTRYIPARRVRHYSVVATESVAMGSVRSSTLQPCVDGQRCSLGMPVRPEQAWQHYEELHNHGRV